MFGGKARNVALLAMVACLGTAVALYLEWPEFSARGIYHIDLRQSPHWATYHTSAERSDNLILEYAAYNESPLQNAIYWLGTFLVDSIRLSKILSVVGYGLLTVLFYLVGRAIYGTRSGLLMALVFALFPNSFIYSSGFFSKFWAIPTVLLCVLVLHTGKWRWLVALMPFAALAYPTTAIVVGLISAIELCQLLVLDRVQARKLFVWLSVASVAAVAVLMLKYFDPPAFLGSMQSTADMKSLLVRRGWEFLPLTKELGSRLGTAFLIFGSALYLLVLRKQVAWERTWTSVLLAAMIGYVAADQLFPRLYIPDRYSRYSLIVLAVLWHAGNIDRILTRIPRPWLRRAVLAVLLAGAFLYHRDTFDRAEYSGDATDLEPVGAFIRKLPEGTLLAGPPYELDDIVVLSGRPGMHSHLTDHRWYLGHMREMRRRTLDVFGAVYAEEAGPINALRQRYGATHLVVSRDYFGDRFRRDRFRSRYDEAVVELIGGRRNFLVLSPPVGSIVYDDGDTMVLQLPLPAVTPSRGHHDSLDND